MATKLVLDPGNAETLATTLGPFNPGTYAVSVTPTSDTGIDGTPLTGTQLVQGAPERPGPISYLDGDITDTRVVADASETGGASYNGYDVEELNGPTEIETVAFTHVSGTGQLIFSLPNLNTNVLVNRDDFDAAAWTASNASSTDSTVVDASATQYGYIFQTVAAVEGYYCLVCYFAKTVSDIVFGGIALRDANGVQVTVALDTNLGVAQIITALSTHGDLFTVQDNGDYWRLSIRLKNPSTSATITARIYAAICGADFVPDVALENTVSVRRSWMAQARTPLNEHGARWIQIKSVLAGVESDARKFLLEYDADGEVTLGIPNIPRLIFNTPPVSGGRNLQVHYTYDTTGEDGVASKIQTRIRKHETSVVTEQASQAISSTTANGIREGDLSIGSGSDGFFQVSIRALTALDDPSDWSDWSPPVWCSNVTPNAPTNLVTTVVG